MKASPSAVAARRSPAWPRDMVVFAGGPFALGLGRPLAVQVAPFALGRREVTMGEYREYAEAAAVSGPLPWEGVADFSRVRDLPVNQVSRKQAAGYCRWRYASCGGRLPTEAEWEYAARDGNLAKSFPFFGAPVAGRANLRGKARGLLPVGSLPEGRSEHGLFDLIGNVAEWTDGEGGPYPVPAGKGVVRGGGADSSPSETSATTRAFVDPARQDPFIGMRCACEAPGDSSDEKGP